MPVDEFYVVSTTLNPGVQYNVTRAEMEYLAELGILIGGPVAPAEVMDSQLADLVNDVSSLLHAAIEAFPPGPHSHLAVDISDSGSVGRSLLAATASLGARATLGLDQVSNTSDANKPVSTAQQAALDLKAPLASPAFTGTPTGITKTHVGLGNVDNTSDANKPVSTAQATALSGKANTTHTHVATTDLTATGTKDTTTFLRGDNTWAVPAGGGGGWTAVDASETVKGIVELATTAEATTGTDTVRAVTPAGVKAVGDTKVAASDVRVTADQAAGTASIRTLGTSATSAKAGNWTPGIADLPAGSTLYMDQNDPAGTWPNRPTSRTDIRVIWTKTVVGSADPTIVTSPTLTGAYAKDFVVGV